MSSLNILYFSWDEWSTAIFRTHKAKIYSRFLLVEWLTLCFLLCSWNSLSLILRIDPNQRKDFFAPFNIDKSEHFLASQHCRVVASAQLQKILHLKGQCHEIFCNFIISWIEAIWAPNKQSKMVLLKNSFLRRYSQNQWLHTVLACTESDSPQANTARSRTPLRLTLCGVELIFSIFEHLYFQRI